MTSSIKNLIGNVKRMPSPLSGFTVVLWMCGLSLAVASLILGWENTVTGREIPHSEFWSSFDGSLAIFLTGCGLFALGYVIYRGWSWVRHALMLGLIGITLSGFVNPDYREVPALILITVALVTCVSGLRYFYFKKHVIAHFTQTLPEAEQGGAHQPTTTE